MSALLYKHYHKSLWFSHTHIWSSSMPHSWYSTGVHADLKQYDNACDWMNLLTSVLLLKTERGGNELEWKSGMTVELESFLLQRALTKAVNIYPCPIKLSFPNDYFRSLLAGALLLAYWSLQGDPLSHSWLCDLYHRLNCLVRGEINCYFFFTKLHKMLAIYNLIKI